MAKILNDKYYTPIPLANRLIDKVIEVIGKENITEVVEPSAGNGSFYNILKEKFANVKVSAFDIQPETEGIIKADYLTLTEQYKKGRLYIGNPPFGTHNWTSYNFYKKNIVNGDYIAYIQPISQLNNKIKFYHFDLIYSEDLGVIDYSGVNLHCCFNIWKRPKSLKFNPKPNVKLKEVTIKEYRRGGSYTLDTIDTNFDYCMCNFGNGSFGNTPSYIGEYAQELYFYCHNKEKVELLKSLLERETIRRYCHSIAAKKMSMAKFYLYLKENGFE